MKKTVIYLSAFLILLNASFFKIYAQSKDELSGNITLSGAFALYPMAVKWAEEFKKIHPNVKINLSAGGAGKGMTDAIAKVVDVGMVSREIYPAEVKKGAYGIAVTKDAVVATISAKNPHLADILSHGLKKDAANNVFITGKYKTWGQAVGAKGATPIRVYTRSDACGAAESWAKYFGKKQEDLLGVGVFGDPGLALAVSRDPQGIGYNNIGYAYDAKTKLPNPGIKVVPIDLNNNGKIDADENFYNTLDQLVNAIATGKYPSPPARDLYFVTSGKPTKKVLVEFIKWVLTDGQKYVHNAGYINLSKDKLEKELGKVK
ncbi:MAG: substrate-binding domain-containing protein [Bacteroidota bacterium]|nr:substrate-binding domain-containing protein [Bacteroidota bacterium]